MGGKILIAAPLWAVRYRKESGYFYSRYNAAKAQILHYQGFDAYMSDAPILQMYSLS
jgi:hypothetical protein